ncbi:MAG: hypothetical protein QXT68_04460 [Halobacteria archaeon]
MKGVSGLILAILLLTTVLAATAGVALADGDDRKAGKVHSGKRLAKAEPLEYEIVYTQSRGILTIGPGGCTYFFPAWNWYWSPPCSYGPSYYRDYMVYFINDWMHYEVHLKNNGKKTLKNLVVSATQEYHEDVCYWTGVCVKKGDDMPGAPTRTWTLAELKPGEVAVLTGSYYAPSDTLPGLDQTHLTITSQKNGKALGHDRDGNGDDDHRNGRGNGHNRQIVLVDDPEAGVYCPPEPVTAPA